MMEAVRLAQKGAGFVNPNPKVGAVIVKDNKIIAGGFHRKFGTLHAERDALRDASERGVDVRGAEMFVTLEPCCHFGKQPPCTQAIIESGIKKVYIGSRDPNPLVNGKGVKLLEDAGIEVVRDFLREECDALNPYFFHYIKTKIPYVILKYAVTADGLTATSNGKSRWISNEKSRAYVHKIRSEVSAVMTGIATVKSDDPMLNVRLDDGEVHHQPVRVVLDSKLELPPESKLALTTCEIPVIDVCALNADEEALKRKAALKNLGVEFLECEQNENGHFDLESLFKKLGERNIDSVLVESGGGLNASLLFENEEPLVNEVNVFIAPKIFGNDGKNVFSPVRGLGIEEVSDCVKLTKPDVQFFDDDILLRFKLCSQE